MTPIALDIESDAVNPSPQRLVSVAIAGRDIGAHLFHRNDPRLPAVVRSVLRGGIILAFAPGDVCMLLRWDPTLIADVIDAYQGGRVFDVLTREKKIDIAEGMLKFRGGYGLDSVALRRANVELPKKELAQPALARIGIVCRPDLEIRLAFGLVEHLPCEQWPPEFRRYAIADAIGTLGVFEGQEAFRGANVADVFACSPIEAMAHLPLYLQQIRGIDVDRKWTDALARSIKDKIAELEQTLVQYGLARVGGTKKNPKIVKSENAARAMMEATGRTKKTATGQARIDIGSMKEALLPVGHPLRVYADLATLQATATKNLRPLLAFDVVRTKYDECVSTGRTSSSAPDDADDGTNWQNLPRPPQKAGLDVVRDLMGRLRGCLVPPPGYVFGVSDLSGIELGTFADTEILWCGSSKLGEAINAGINAHQLFGCDLVGIEYSAYDKSNPEHKDARQVAKIKNFGSLGGMGPPSFQRHLYKAIDVLQPIELVRRQHQLWLQRWRVKQYFDKINSFIGPDGYATIVEPRTGFVRGRMRYTEACNFPFQSKAAIVAKLGLWWLWLASMDPNSPLFGCWQCIFVHDENVSCFPIDRADAALAEQNRLMTLAARTICPTVAITVEGHNVERYGK